MTDESYPEIRRGSGHDELKEIAGFVFLSRTRKSFDGTPTTQKRWWTEPL
jgi:hypothetical protein